MIAPDVTDRNKVAHVYTWATFRSTLHIRTLADRDHPLDRAARARAIAARPPPRAFRRAAQSRSFSSVIIFMNRQTAASRAASNRLLRHLAVAGGGGSRSRSRRRTARAAIACANSTMPSVERMCVRSFPNAIAWLAQPHSGWTSNSASGASRLPALDVGRAGCPHGRGTHRARSAACGPVTRSSQRPRYMSGRKRISRSAGIDSITARALPEVQQ